MQGDSFDGQGIKNKCKQRVRSLGYQKKPIKMQKINRLINPNESGSTTSQDSQFPVKSKQDWEEAFRFNVFQQTINYYQKLKSVQRIQLKAIQYQINQKKFIIKSKQIARMDSIINVQGVLKKSNFQNNIQIAELSQRIHDLIQQSIRKKQQLIQRRQQSQSYSNNEQTLQINFIFNQNQCFLLFELVKIMFQNFENHALKQLCKQLQDYFAQSPFEYTQYFQTLEIISKITQKFSAAIQKQQYKGQIKAIDQIFNSKKLLDSIQLYNFVMICHEYDKRQFNINYYCKLYNIATQKMSKLQIKLQFFWKTYNQPNILKRIYSSCTISFKQMEQVKNYQKFTLQSLYQRFIDAKQVQQKIRYFTHFSQYYHQIINQLSSSQNISLASTFNSFRFLILNFISFFQIYLFKRIQKQILEKHGQLYYESFKNLLQKDQKFRDCKNKTNQAVKLSYDKITKYIQESDKTKKAEERSTNVRKLQKIFKDNKEMKELFFKLNKQHQQDRQSNKYDFQLVKRIYTTVLTLLFKEFSNKLVLERNFKKICKKHQQFCLKNNLSFQNIEQINLIKQKKQSEFIIYEFTIVFLQVIKLLSMVLSLPYYSFNNQLFNRKRKNKLSIGQDTGSTIFQNLDSLYIYKRHRLSNQYIRKNKQENQSQIFWDYMKLSKQLLSFIREKDVEQKQNIIRTRPNGQEFQNQKLIHQKRMSIFDEQQCKQYFFRLFDPLLQQKGSNLQTLEPNIGNPIGISPGQKLQNEVREFFCQLQKFEELKKQNQLILPTMGMQNQKYFNKNK